MSDKTCEVCGQWLPPWSIAAHNCPGALKRPDTQYVGEYDAVVGNALTKLETGAELSPQDKAVLWLAVRMFKDHGVTCQRAE